MPISLRRCDEALKESPAADGSGRHPGGAAGLPPHAWHFFAIFAGVIVGLMIEPLPGGAIGLIGVTLVTVLAPWVLYAPAELAKPGFKPANAALTWALSGFSNSTVWLIFGAFMFALGYEKTGLGRRIALLLVKKMGRRTLTLGYAVMAADTILAPFTAMVLLVLVFYFTHYLFASVTAHVTALLPVMLAVGSTIPGINLPLFALLLCLTLGIMGVLTPYATGPSPVYYGSGYLPARDYWRLGGIFGVLFIVVFLVIGLPWLALIR